MGNVLRIETLSAPPMFGSNSLVGQAAAELLLAGERMMAMAGMLRANDTDPRAHNVSIAPPNAWSPCRPTKGALRTWASDEYRRRRARASVFAGSMLREPAWDILLDLYIAHLDATAIRVSSACIAACVPATTGLRWLAVLEEQGLIIRTQDDDARASLVALTKHGACKMTEYVSAMIDKQKSSIANSD